MRTKGLWIVYWDCVKLYIDSCKPQATSNEHECIIGGGISSCV